MFELGYLIIFAVSGLDFLLLFLLSGYFIRELIHRQSWQSRTSRSKKTFAVCAVLFIALLYRPLDMFWLSRLGAVPGGYSAQGVWGNATLTIRPDNTFTEKWTFVNEYNGKPEGDGVTDGTWHDGGRGWFTRTIVLTKFKGLASYIRDRPPSTNYVILMGYSSGGLDVDSGADIVFFK